MSRWNKYNDVELQSYFYERKSIEEIAKIMRRHPLSVKERIEHLKLHDKRRNADKVPDWTSYEDKKILKGVDAKRSASVIAAQIGRHKQAVIDRIRVLMQA